MTTNKRLTCWIFIDALGWELFQRRPLLADLWRTTAPMDSILGYSCACDPTILTGKMPREHGHFSFFVPAQGRSPLASMSWLRWFPERLENHGRVRSRLSRHLARREGFTGYFQLYHVPARYLKHFDYSEQRDLYQPGGINGGQATFLDSLREDDVPFWMGDWRQGDEANVAEARRTIDQGEVAFAYLYLARLDGRLHAEGLDGASIEPQLSWYETRLRELHELASRRYQDVRFRLISDHGMANVTHGVDLQARLRTTGLEIGRDYLVMLDSTMARFWFWGTSEQRQQRAARVTEALADEPAGHWLDDEELASLGCDFPDRRFGDAIFLLHEGGLIVPSFMNRRFVAGMHGYHPSSPSATATVAATESMSLPPTRLDGIFDCVERDIDWLLGRSPRVGDTEIPRHPIPVMGFGPATSSMESPVP